ncbi:hypothetical protein B0T14DRAFT_565079 [Immersiella caudata]|uniref:Uncharacterized protein n=1 Tax=Immersiella caudata TaxID=314043 RepID=A0AA39WY63_9PEZI|nr:hypothetical protein B0T14DRAFT_565079 [Immersiella caudata]
MDSLSFKELNLFDTLQFHLWRQPSRIFHFALFAIQSPAFDRLVHGPFKEAQDRHAVLESVSEETFALFTQNELRETPVGAPLVSPRAPTYNSPEFDNTPRERQTIELWEKVRRVAWCSINQTSQSMRPRSSTLITDELLSPRAHVYVFADCCCVKELAQLSLHKLSTGLVTIKVTSDMDSEVMGKLVDYCYTEPAPDTLKSHLLLPAPVRYIPIPKYGPYTATTANPGYYAPGARPRQEQRQEERPVKRMAQTSGLRSWADAALEYAKVFVFSARHGIDKLQDLALQNLHEEPNLLESGEECLKLIEYCYRQDAPDKIKEDLVELTFRNSEKLSKDPLLRESASGESEFALALLNRLMREK